MAKTPLEWEFDENDIPMIDWEELQDAVQDSYYLAKDTYMSFDKQVELLYQRYIDVVDQIDALEDQIDELYDKQAEITKSADLVAEQARTSLNDIESQLVGWIDIDAIAKQTGVYNTDEYNKVDDLDVKSWRFKDDLENLIVRITRLFH